MTIRRLPALVIGLCLVAVACGGGDDDGASPVDGTDSSADAGGAADAGDGTGDDAPGEDADDGASPGGGAVEGLVTLVSGLGAFAVEPDAAGGSLIDFDGMDGVSVGTQPTTDGEAVYVITFRGLEGQSFSNEAFIGRIDLATGETSVGARVGVDRENDDAEELTEYGPMVAVGGDVWVYSQVFGETSGELSRFSASSPDGPVASVTLSRPRGLHTDGEMIYVWTASGLTVVDPASGAASVLVEADQLVVDLEPTVDFASLIVTRSGATLTAEDLDRVADGLGVGGGSIGGTAFADGVFWVTVGELLQSSPETVLAEAVIGFDVSDGSVVSVVGTAGAGSYFPEENSFAVGDQEIAAVDGSVWVVDRQDNGAVLRVDPGAGTVETVYRPCDETLECENGRLLLTDPDAVWLELTRFEPDGDGGRSGQVWVERLDPATGLPAASAPLQDLLFG